MSREQLAAEHGMSVEYVNWFFDHKKEGCGNVWFMMMAAMWEGWQAASKASEQQLSESRREFTAANATIHNLELQLADAEARGVDKFATEIGSVYKQLRPGSNHAHALKSVVFRAVEFAAQLRQGAEHE